MWKANPVVQKGHSSKRERKLTRERATFKRCEKSAWKSNQNERNKKTTITKRASSWHYCELRFFRDDLRKLMKKKQEGISLQTTLLTAIDLFVHSICMVDGGAPERRTLVLLLIYLHTQQNKTHTIIGGQLDRESCCCYSEKKHWWWWWKCCCCCRMMMMMIVLLYLFTIILIIHQQEKQTTNQPFSFYR